MSHMDATRVVVGATQLQTIREDYPPLRQRTKVWASGAGSSPSAILAFKRGVWLPIDLVEAEISFFRECNYSLVTWTLMPSDGHVNRAN